MPQAACQYGAGRPSANLARTYVLRKPDTTKFYTAAENIFLPAEDASFYNYEKVEQHLKILVVRVENRGPPGF